MVKGLVVQPKNLHITDEIPLDQNPVAIYLNGLTSRQSRRTMTNALRTIVAFITDRPLTQVRDVHMLSLNWASLRYQHTAAIRAGLINKYSASSVNRMLAAMRGVLKEAWRLGQLSAEEYQRAIDIQNVRNHTVPAGREVTGGELFALVQACKADDSPAGIRDAALIGMLYTCGLRREEIVNLSRRDVDLDTGRMVVKIAKGGKQRSVYVTDGALRALKSWVALAPEADIDEALFLPIRKNGKIEFRQMTSQAIYLILKKRGKEAGIKDFSPHDLRRTFVGDMLERGVDIATVANIAGHSSVDTTRRYDRRPEGIKKKAAKKLNFPY